jgi:hypothetical protein
MSDTLCKVNPLVAELRKKSWETAYEAAGVVLLQRASDAIERLERELAEAKEQRDQFRRECLTNENMAAGHDAIVATLRTENAALKKLEDDMRRAIASFVPANENISERGTLEALNVLFRRIVHGYWPSDARRALEETKRQRTCSQQS